MAQATLSINANLNIQQVLNSIKQIKSNLNGLSLPKNLSQQFGSAASKLEKSLNELSLFSGKELNIDEAKQALKIIEDIQKAGVNFQGVLKNIGGLDLKNLKLDSFAKSYDDITNAVKKYEQAVENAKKSTTNAYAKAQAEQKDLKSRITAARSNLNEKTVKRDVAFLDLEAEKQKLEEAKRIAEEYKKTVSEEVYNKSDQKANVDATGKRVTTLQNRVTDIDTTIKNLKKTIADYEKQITQLESTKKRSISATPAVQNAWNEIINLFKGSNVPGVDKIAKYDLDAVNSALKGLETSQGEKVKKLLADIQKNASGAAGGVDQLNNSGKSLKGAVTTTEQFNRELDMMQNRIQYFFGLNNSIQLLKRGLREAYSTVKELDSAMTETAVVTDYTVSDMWDQLPLYTETANQLGATTLGAYQTMTLFYQQGLKTNAAFQLGTETMKMARIANMEYATATDMMTAALRGFNMALNETSAKRINDVYSELAAITAADTEEIATAMTKTASIANSANMEFETTAAFLSQIIETTREAPETAGTALKTIIARFTEVKQLYSKGQLTGKDSEGEAININKIDTALQSVGLSLKGFLRGEEGLDDILLQLASKWDTLDIATQRYIATMAAGSRQQSRFLAMMSDYDRTLELVEAANTSAGASDRQFEKTLDSLESKLNKLSNAWDQFTMGLADNKVIKLAVNGLTALLDIVNKLTNIPGGGLLKILLGASVLRGGGTLLQTGVNWLANTLTGGAGKGAIFTTLQQAGVPDLDQMSQAEMSSKYKDILGRQFLGPFYGLGGRIKSNRAANFSKASNIDKDLQWQQLQKISGVFINDSTSIEKAKKIIASNPSMQAQAMTQLGLYSNFSGKLGTKLAKVGFGTRTSWGKKVAESGFAKKIASSFGLIEAGAGTAAGALASLASVLGAVAAAAAVIYGIVKFIDARNISTKEAQKNASNLAEAKNTAKENRDSYNEQIKNYKELQKTLKNTTKGTSDWNNALTENNDAVLQMASQFSDLSYEVDSTTGALQLTEDSQKAVSEQLKSGAKTTNIASALAESYSLSRQAKDKITSANNIASTNYGVDAAGQVIGASEQDLIKADSLKNEAKNLENQARAQFENAINQIDLGNSEAAKNLSSIVSQQVLTDYNDAIEETSKKYIGKGKDYLYSALSDMYGLTEDQAKEIFGDEELFNEEYARIALATGEVATGEGGLQDQLSTLVNNLNNLDNISGNQVGTLNQVLSGVSDVDLSNLKGITKDDIASYLETLYGENTEEFKEAGAKFYTNYLNAIADQAKTTAIARESIGSTFDALSSETQLNVAEMLTSAQERFGVEGVQGIKDILAKASKDEISQVADDLTTIYNKIDFSNPIKALRQINTYANSTNSSIKALGDALLSISEDDTSVLGTSAQFKYLYENVFSSDENIQDLLDDLGELDADDIYDLADSFSDVDDFLKKGKTTAAGLAAVLNEINNNGLNANLITGGFLEAMSQANSYTSNMLDTIKKLDSIDFGTDYGQVADTVGEWAEQWKEMINNGELGNQQVAKMYDYWYGEGSWVKLAESGIDNVKAASQELYNYLNSVAKRGDMAKVWKDLFTGGEAITGENFSAVWDEANNQILWNIENGASFNEILAAVQEKGKQLGLNFSEEVYRMMLTDAANQSLDLSRLVDAEGVESALNILLDSIGESGIVDKAQLDAIYNTATDIDQARQIGEELIKQKGLIVDEWAPDTLSKGIAAGFNEATKAVGEYQKVIEDAFKDIKNGKSVINLDTLTQFASEEDVFAQLVKGAEDAGTEISYIWSKEFGNIKVDWSKVKDDFGGDLNAYLQDAVDTAQTLEYADAIGQAVSNALTNLKIEKVDASSVSEAIKTAIASADKKVKLTASISGSGTISVKGKQFKVTVAGAMGGYVPSYAAGSGNNKLSKGTALTGEEAPEIVWNKKKGYAYLAGANGPEYNNLQPGDRVFNKEETKKILRNSKRKKRPSLAEGGFITPSYGGGSATSYKPTSNWIGGGGAVTPSDKGDKDKWKNEFDWLYNLLEDIAELERDQNKLNEKYEDYLEDINKTAADLVKITTQELSNLYAQQARQQLSYDKRVQEMNEYLAVNSDLAQYGRYNFDDMTIEIDWDAIEAVQDQELYSKIEDYVEGLEDIQDKIDEADDALIDIENDIQDIEQRFQEEYVDFENRILDAIVNSRKQQIDQLSEINDSIKDTNSKLLDAVQKSLEQQRQDRENQKTEDEIAEKERRLSFLRQDTSRDNTLDILALEDELKDLKEDYTDELIDQKLTLLQDQENFAAEQRERQIALMESQLDYDKETGQMWEEINALIQGSIGSDGKLINDSALANLLRDTENWASLSDVQKQLWEDTLITDFNTAYAYILMQGVDQVKLKMNEITNMMDTIAKSLPNYSQAKEKNPTNSSSGGGSGGGSGGNGGSGGSGSTSPAYDGWRLFINGSVYGTYSSKELASRTLGSLQTKAALQVATAQKNYDAVKNQVGPTAQKGKALDELVKAKNYLKSLKNATIQGYYVRTGGSGGGGKMTMKAYATGGLNTTTGPAWLDGTKSKPELVLNAKDTQNFLTLKDILSEVMTNSSSTDGTTKKGDTYINVSVQAELSNDYDVEKLTKKIKDEIYKDGSYRGVNIIHKIR